MPSAGFLIYSGVMPLIKTYITILAGYVVAKMGFFPLAASRGASRITMDVALPALIFANVIPAFNPSNISALGPLFLTAFTYQAIGFVFGWAIREICYVPRNFWQGIVVLTGMSNWGNLPTAVVLSVTAQKPFNPDTDPELGVSYISIFIVAYHIVFWMLGAAHSISWDYLPGVPQGEAAERHVSWKEKPIGSLFTRYILRQPVPNSFALPPPEPRGDEEAPSAGEKQRADAVDVSEMPVSADVTRAPTPVEGIHEELKASSSSPASTNSKEDEEAVAQSATPTLSPPTFAQRIMKRLRPFSVVVTPVTITLAISLPIALIDPLKALFVDISAQGGPAFFGPDNRPPLAFMIDTAKFLGGITVPLALILLGVSFSRIELARPLSRLPLMAMFMCTMVKMVVLPVIGVFLVQAMTNSGFVDRKAITLRFVLMFLSGTPTAVNQLIVASLYAPEGKTNTLAAFLFVQYVFMIISSSALTAVALLLL